MNINEIPLNKKYEGYLWLSNSIEPKVLDNQKINLELKEGMMPFIVEGQLYNSTDHISYSIKYVNGEHLVTKYENVSPEDKSNNNVEEKAYLSNRMDDRELVFHRYWELVEDENCENMKTLVITKNVFIGFKK